MKVASALRVETGAGAIGNPRWIALLASIEGGSRSITAAAKASGLSYKAAWDAVETMNNLAERAVVVTSVGGRGGGGARLTPHGRELLATYRAVEAENTQFLRQVNARLAGRNQAPALGRLSLRTSARNQWAGSVTRLRRGAVNDEVEVALGGGDRIVAIVTHASVENLGLRKGVDVIALVKASSVLVGTGRQARLQLSARNQLAGRVARIVRGAVNSEIVLALRGGNTVAAIITNPAATELALKPGQRALAIFKASSVILAVG
jgi:molybdenum-pterin binding domain